MHKDSLPDGYTLVVCEKPDAAKRVSEALSGGDAQEAQLEGVLFFKFRSGPESFVVCSAQGHVYAVSDPFLERAVYPVFDVEWYPLDKVEKRSWSAARRIAAIRKLSGGATRLVNACDFDAEGETIGYNVLRYACQGRERQALRAKFSTLTKEELVEAFRLAAPQPSDGLARAGRARHYVDFAWGVNLSRVLSQSALVSGHRFRTVSMGRVQGPTLKFLIERECELQEFVPMPFWKVAGVFERDGERLVAPYSVDRIRKKADAEKARDECVGKEGVVRDVKKNVVQIPPYPPFNIGDLQKEAFRAFGFSPTRTLQVAEKLYLGALISYPRTGSQKLPWSLNFAAILEGLRGIPGYSKQAEQLLKGDLRPIEGAKADPAHPAVHPTGERPGRHLDSSEEKVFDLVVRRFLAAFAPSAKREVVSVTIAVGDHEFRLSGGHTIYTGWMPYYGTYWNPRDQEIPRVVEGEKLRVMDVRTDERFEEAPRRFNQASLLEKLEQAKLGTKATRADIIATLLERNYAAGESLTVTGLGFSVYEIMERHAPSVITTELTRAIEDRLEAVEEGSEDGRGIVRDSVRAISEELVRLASDEEAVGREIDVALTASVISASVLGNCPVCKTGKLRVIRSKTTKKRFVGCTNYSAGCRASAPLPQLGEVRATSKTCQSCSWPMVNIVRGRRPWRLCVNAGCPLKKGKR